MTNAVRWDDLSPDLFEDMCAVLVSRTYPEARRIDGSGGDGGRDVLITTTDGPIIYEMKSFTGRLHAGRRRQVERSLARAAHHKPYSWILLVPIDPTPAEEKWFDTITAQHSFSCIWQGKTWLDAQMSKYPEVARYYLQGANDDVVDILRELSKEEGALARGVPDAVERMKVLSRRLNALDPHYSFGISIDEGGAAAITVWPKYVGAERDHPLKVDTLFQFPPNARGKAAANILQHALDYGTSATIEPEYIQKIAVTMPGGITESFDAGLIQIGPAEDLGIPPFGMQLRVIDENGRTRAQLPLRGRTTNLGRKGGNALMKDPTGALEADIRFDTGQRRLSATFRYSTIDGQLPAEMLPGLQFLDQYRPPHSIVILIGEKQVVAPTPIDAPIYEDVKPFLALVRALDDIQRQSGVYFPLPRELSNEELRGIHVAQRLLAGEEVRGSWSTMTMSSTIGALPSLEASMANGPGQVMIEAELTIKIAGQDIPLGYTRRILPSAAVVEWPELGDDSSPDTPIEIIFRPGADNSSIESLIQEDERKGKKSPAS